MKNDISQSLGLDIDNIKVYAEVYQNIPLSSRDKAIFTFSEFEPRQRLGQSQMTFDNLLGYILSISMRMQNLSKYSNGLRVVDIFRHFSRTGRRQNLHKLSGDKIIWPTQENCLLSNLYQSQTIYHSSRTDGKGNNCSPSLRHLISMTWKGEAVFIGLKLSVNVLCWLIRKSYNMYNF